jgi:phosphoribosylformylglycinamidine synthase
MKSSLAKNSSTNASLIYQNETAYLQAAGEMGLTADEARLAEKKLGRRPNHVELGMISAMWSEHCSYKSSRVLLKQFPTKGASVLQGPGENAGIVDLGEGLALCFKIESHNHPSYIEPYQGAATGVGGILRDVFTMGARPIAFMNSLRFGDPKNPRTKFLVKGVVKGIGGYGNCVGIPTIGGEVSFDSTYQGNILVNAFCAGILDKDKIFLSSAQGVGNLVVYIGSKTGRDGIHGATMASDSFDEASLERRPTVQVGDPFTGKLLMEATLEMMRRKLVVGIQDMGAAGLTCSICEMSDKGGCGMEVELSEVPIREEGMNPYEMLLSESQERMLLVCTPEMKESVFAVAKHWGIDAAVIGKVVSEPRIKLFFHGELVVDLPPQLLSNDAPIYQREIQAPSSPRSFSVTTAEQLKTAKDLDVNDLLIKLLKSANLSNRSWVYRQYDQCVGTDVIRRCGGDAAILRVKNKKFGIAMSTDGNSSYCAADPYLGGQIAVAEASRNLACVGAAPLALTNCLNFGNPERPEIMWQLDQAIKGIAKSCETFNIPVISGNVSLYNQHDERDIPPTPVISVCGKIDELPVVTTANFEKSHQVIYLLGSLRPNKLLNGEVARLLLGERHDAFGHRLWPQCPSLDLALEKNLQTTVRQLVRENIVTTAHDCSDGGLAVALAECCFGENSIGAQITLPQEWNGLDLFSEEQSRVVVALPESQLEKMQAITQANGCPIIKLGYTSDNQKLLIEGSNFKISQSVSTMREATLSFFKELSQ